MLTEEREKEIRDYINSPHPLPFIQKMMRDLIKEIDQLRADIKVHKQNEKELEKASNNWMRGYEDMVEKYDDEYSPSVPYDPKQCETGCMNFTECEKLRHERDQLKAELEILKDPSDGRCMDISALRAEFERVCKENEKLKIHLDLTTRIIKEFSARKKATYSWEPPLEVQLEGCVKTKDRISMEKQKLQDRIEKLREGLDQISDPRKRDHTEPNDYTNVGCIMYIATVTLEQDNVYSKP